MYDGYEKVKEYLDTAKELENTSQKMEDIFNYFTIKHSKNIAVIYTNEKGKIKQYKYKIFRRHTFELAGSITDSLKDIGTNKVVALKLANSPKWAELFWAILMSGYKPLLMDAKTSKEGTANLLAQSKAIAIVTDDPHQYDVIKLTPLHVITNKHNLFMTNWENEVIFCSSGTTGDVKLMVFNGQNIVNQILASLDMSQETKDIMYPKKMGDVRNLAMIPFHHVFGFVAIFLWYTFYGKTLVYPNSINPTEIQTLCKKQKVTHVYSVPLFWDSLVTSFERKAALEPEEKQKIIRNIISYNTGKISKQEAGIAASSAATKKIQNLLLGDHIRYCISGGGYLNSHTANVINGVGYPLYNGFGMTELGVTSVELSPNVSDRLKGSIGRPLHGVSYKIKEDSKGSNKGELFVKSEITHIREIIGGVEKNTVLDNEGYFATGDIAESDASGSYYIKGRIKDIIINANGENIFPDELEIYFKSINKVKNVCILGIKKPKSTDEEITLVVEIDNSITDDELKEVKSLIEKQGSNLPKGTKIEKVYFSRGRLPLANNMKVKRFLVKKAIESNSNEYISIDAKKETKSFKGFDKEQVEPVLEKVRDLFSEVLILPKFKIEDNGHWINDLGGDSMNYVELVSKIDDAFNITIEEEKYGQLTCVNDFVYEILTKLKEGKKK